MHLSSKERFLRAVSMEEPDRVPLTEYFLQPKIQDKILGEEFKRETAVLSAGGDLAEISSRATFRCLKKLGMDALWAFWSQPEGFPKPVDKKKGLWADEWGVKFKYAAGLYESAWWVGGSIETPEDFEKMQIPDPEAQGRMYSLEIAKDEAADGELAVVGVVFGAFSQACLLFPSIDRFLVYFYRNPKFVEKIMQTITDWFIKVGLKIIECGVDAFMVADDLADNRGPLMSPSMLRKYVFPFLKKQISAYNLKKHGLPLLFHSDGNVTPILDDLIDLGINGLNPIQPQVMDIHKIKEKVGDKICLLGNIDMVNTLPYGTVEDVKREVIDRIRTCAPGGGYVLMSSHTIQSNTPVQNVLAMVETARRYGKYPIRH